MPTMMVDDYRIYAQTEEQIGTSIYVVADILTMGWNWPLKLTYRGKEYKFLRNEVMEDWMVGNYGGHAKYIEILNESAHTGY